MDPVFSDVSRQTQKNINVIVKTPSKQRFAEILATPMGQHLSKVCNSVYQLASPCFPKTCLNSSSGQMEVADSTLQFVYTED